MRIITWNCQMAFRKKWPALIDYAPDIMVIQECEHPSRYKPEQLMPGVSDFLWIGDNEHKGLGIISFNGLRLNIAADYNDHFRYVVPVRVSGSIDMRLWAIWAMPVKNRKADSYVGQVWKAVNYYEPMFANGRTIIIGDLNSNAIWDNERKQGNHTMVVDLLKRYDIESIYHRQNGESHGKESRPTFFLTKKREMPYHLDYCFLSADLISNQTAISVGAYDNWIKLSDHVPLIIDF